MKITGNCTILQETSGINHPHLRNLWACNIRVRCLREGVATLFTKSLGHGFLVLKPLTSVPDFSFSAFFVLKNDYRVFQPQCWDAWQPHGGSPALQWIQRGNVPLKPDKTDPYGWQARGALVRYAPCPFLQIKEGAATGHDATWRGDRWCHKLILSPMI